ncbi:hypothetical protein Leryth_019260 [Lithospermum erythrorhizon]|uniref:Uncharacterized protein n=1 Tax=Lithospermum erythrorhizon TaxID=34254 RepID=A0AAV3NWJ9_LITER|nr:hypothetical protein Leryth_019260 [Lithospermum erythrorhizon]
MQTIKDKLHDMTAMREAKAEAKQEEQAQREMAKARVEVAHEVRKAREAEAAMDLHVNRAAEKAISHESKQQPHQQNDDTSSNQSNNYGHDSTGRPYTDDDFFNIDSQDGSNIDTRSNTKR